MMNIFASKTTITSHLLPGSRICSDFIAKVIFCLIYHSHIKFKVERYLVFGKNAVIPKLLQF